MNSAGVDIQKILTIIRPNAKWRMTGEEYDGLVWISDGQGGGKPLYSEIEAASPTLVAAEQLLQTKRQNVVSSINGLRNWADDVEAALLQWDAWTTAQRFAALKTLMTRFGTMSDRLADLLEGHSFDKIKS